MPPLEGPGMKLERMLEVPPDGPGAPEADHGVNWWFWCFGCDSFHSYRERAAKGRQPQPVWTFNGNLERPSFTPSLLYNRDGTNPALPRCHLYLTDGKLQYLADCTHALAGRTLALGERP